MIGKPRGEAAPPGVAGQQHDVFTVAQALADGYPARQVERLVANGLWRRVVGRGLTARSPGAADASGGCRWPPLLLAWAAHLTWPDAVVARRVAAAVHGFPVVPGERVDVLLRPRRRPCNGVIPHREPLAPGDVARLPGDLPVTSPTRTAIDCLATLAPDDAWSLLAWLVTHRRLDRGRLTDHLVRRTGRPGTAQLRTLHAGTSGGALSRAERQIHDLLEHSGVTGWVANARVYDVQGLIGVVDLLFPEARIVVEIDGYASHAGRDAFIRDRRRQNRLSLAGYQVLRFTWWDLVDAPDRVLAEIRLALRA